MAKLIKQFFSYFLVGGLAALVEWISFYILNTVLELNYILSTAIAFVLATFANYLLGRKTTFKKAASGRGNFLELFMVYAVSLVGLGFNLLLMKWFVGGLCLNPMVSKILSTGIVFVWNFVSRKFLIYRDKD